MKEVTLCVPFYRQPRMLYKQLRTWNEYDDAMLAQFTFVVVDDGSPEPAEEVVADFFAEASDPHRLLDRVGLYRIKQDIPWNRSGVRNLGSHVAETDFVVHLDTDHVLPLEAAEALLKSDCDPASWYRMRRFRIGKADETRRKDAIADDVEFGEIKPHIDSYLCTRELYWRAGGYNEDFSGCLGGGSPFLAEMTKVGGEPKMLPADVCLHVYTRHVIPDASVFTLDRDTTEYARRKKALMNAGKLKGHDPLRFEWERVL